MNPKENGTEFIIASTVICWFGIISTLSIIFVKFDRSTKNYRNNSITDLIVYIKRFFELSIWLYNIRILQERIQNNYLNIDKQKF